MFYSDNLEEVIFQRHLYFDTDELIIISGYVGPKPIERLDSLPIKSTVIYGMYGEVGVGKNLHSKLCKLETDSNKCKIFYSTIPIHSKIYLWRKKGKVIHALVGSANFSIKGLKTPNREILAATAIDTFSPLNTYSEKIIENAIGILNHVEKITITTPTLTIDEDPNLYIVNLLIKKGGNLVTPAGSGINWGHANAHVTEGDAYIKISRDIINSNPMFFPPKKRKSTFSLGRKSTRQNDSVELIWDDGITMEGLLEGNQLIDDIAYPKQISSSPQKSQLGIYLRKRMGLNPDVFVTKENLEKYGRTNISITLESEGIYYCDFSV